MATSSGTMNDKLLAVTQHGFKVDDDLCARFNLTNTEWQRFQALKEEQQKFHIWLSKNNRVSSLERQALDARTNSDVETWTTLASESHAQLSERYKTGFRRWVKKGQNCSSFIEDIQPIFDVVKSLDPTVSIAIGTVCGLFAVVGRQGAAEGEAIRIVDGIKDRLPGLAVYQNIYRKDKELERDLQKKIILVYVSFIELSMKVTKYCLKPGIKRFLTSFFAMAAFNEMSDNLNAELSAVKQRCEELQTQAIHNLENSNRQLHADNEELLRKVDELQLNEASRCLTEIQGLLDLGAWTSQNHRSSLMNYMKNIDMERSAESVYQQMHYKDINVYMKGRTFTDWQQPGESGILLLQAYNHDAIDGKRHCWLSPLAVHLDDHLSKDGGTPHATYVFERLRNNDSIFEALPVLLMQLLEQSRAKLSADTGHRETITAAIREYTGLLRDGMEGSIDRKSNALAALAEHVIQLFVDSQTVYLIFDRVDLCSTAHQYSFIEVLNRITIKAVCAVKILVITSGSSWRTPKRDFEKISRCKCYCEVMEQKYVSDEDGYW